MWAPGVKCAYVGDDSKVWFNYSRPGMPANAYPQKHLVYTVARVDMKPDISPHPFLVLEEIGMRHAFCSRLFRPIVPLADQLEAIATEMAPVLEPEHQLEPA